MSSWHESAPAVEYTRSNRDANEQCAKHPRVGRHPGGNRKQWMSGMKPCQRPAWQCERPTSPERAAGDSKSSDIADKRCCVAIVSGDCLGLELRESDHQIVIFDMTACL